MSDHFCDSNCDSTSNAKRGAESRLVKGEERTHQCGVVPQLDPDSALGDLGQSGGDGGVKYYHTCLRESGVSALTLEGRIDKTVSLFLGRVDSCNFPSPRDLSHHTVFSQTPTDRPVPNTIPSPLVDGPP